MRVLAPPATRKELVVASKDYYQRLLTNHLTQGTSSEPAPPQRLSSWTDCSPRSMGAGRAGAADLPLESSLVQELLPALHSRAWKPRNGREGYSLFVSKAQQVRTKRSQSACVVCVRVLLIVCRCAYIPAELDGGGARAPLCVRRAGVGQARHGAAAHLPTLDQ
jgi:hypothetical protein